MPSLTQIAIGVGLTLILGCGLLLWWMRRDNQKIGAAEAVNESQKETIADVKKANSARDRLRSDPAYAERVQDRFTRKP